VIIFFDQHKGTELMNRDDQRRKRVSAPLIYVSPHAAVFGFKIEGFSFKDGA